ncbi:hypothetical protein TNCV_2276981 [Trichonephila clavipes]|nr:hypothetical protein TNCV_2276981 [Trichonephila clavipes]
MTSTASWSDRTMPSSDLGTATTGAVATSPSRLSFDDSFIVEHSDLFRETIIARNVYAAWARKLTTAKPNDPDLQNIHMEVAKSGEIVSSHLAKLDIPLFKIPASEKELEKVSGFFRGEPLETRYSAVASPIRSARTLRLLATTANATGLPTQPTPCTHTKRASDFCSPFQGYLD